MATAEINVERPSIEIRLNVKDGDNTQPYFLRFYTDTLTAYSAITTAFDNLKKSTDAYNNDIKSTKDPEERGIIFFRLLEAQSTICINAIQSALEPLEWQKVQHIINYIPTNALLQILTACMKAMSEQLIERIGEHKV